MSMEINNTYSNYRTSQPERLKPEQKETDEAGKIKEAGSEPQKAPVRKDEYIPSEKADRAEADGKKAPAAKADGLKKKPEKCTINTDKVDREIEKLKEKKKQLEQQIQRASGDEEKIRELEKQLSQVESELSMKDNDTYRKQHSTVTNG